ncbi:MAG: TM2 domain-containing protein [Clostridia bacterium]|nr:TM2 domain-containing protein [Clostridia bacterium]
MFCKNCGQPLNPNQAICLNCGVKVGDGTTFCANCGNPVQPGAEVCMSCGFAVKKAGSDLAGKDKLTMILICLFLGGIGIHNFMMGETKKGVVKIVATFCCGLGGILALIDLIKIATDKYEVDPEKLF